KQKKDGTFISQDKYVAEILRKFGLTEEKSASTPIDTEKPLLKDPDGEDVDIHTYRSWLVQKQMALGKDTSNLLMADNLPKIVWYSTHHVTLMKKLASLKANGSWYIKYALTINPHIYVSCIKQFWNTVVVKQTNDVTRLQAIVDRKKVVITEAIIRDALRLDDAEGVDCLPNEEVFAELACMGYEKPSTKLTFYKAFFSSQWKFLIHTILQSMSAKRTSWNEFSSAMASVVICLSTEALDACAALTKRVENLEYDKVAQALEITKLKRRVKKLEKANRVKVLKLRRLKKEDEPAEVQEVVDIVTTAKLITKVVTAASESVTAASTTISAAKPQVPAATITVVPVRVTAASTRKRRKRVVIRDPEEESTTIIPVETKSNDKG
nr:ribonuclease H-like domain-containing protein [Tanacetum cinerariifolium]